MSNFLRRLSGDKENKGKIRPRQSSSDGETPVAKRQTDTKSRNTKKSESKLNAVIYRKQSAKTGITGVTIVEKTVQSMANIKGNMNTDGAAASDPLQEITMRTLLTEIREVKSTMTEVRNEQALLRSFVEDRLQTFQSSITSDMTKLSKNLGDDVKVVAARISNVEIRMGEVEVRCAENLPQEEDFPPEKSIIIRNLKQSGTPDEDLVKEMLHRGMDVPTDNVKVKRLISHTNKPGIIKVQFSSTQDKINALRNKMKLRNIQRYENVYIRTSLPYAERMAQQNMMTLLREVPGARDKLRITGSGKLVLRNEGPTVPRNAPNNVQTENVITEDHLYARHMSPPPQYLGNENVYGLGTNGQVPRHQSSNRTPTSYPNNNQISTISQVSTMYRLPAPTRSPNTEAEYPSLLPAGLQGVQTQL